MIVVSRSKALQKQLDAFTSSLRIEKDMQTLKSKPASIDVNRAISLAIAYMKSLKSAGDFTALKLEEVERQGGRWKITISHRVTKDHESTFDALAGLRFARSYKVVTIDADTGEVMSMKIRQL